MKVHNTSMSGRSPRPKNDSERKSLLLKHGWSKDAADDLIRRGLADQRLEQTGKIAPLADDDHEMSDAEQREFLAELENAIDDHIPRDNWVRRYGESDQAWAHRKNNGRPLTR